MKRKISYFLMVLVGVISTVICIGSVNAAENVRYAFKGDSFWYGEYGTYNKRLCESSSVSKNCKGEVAYCVQRNNKSPESGTKYVLANSGYLSWSSKPEKFLVAAEIINRMNSKNLSDSNKYLYTYIALNKYLNGAFSDISNNTIDDVVNDAKAKSFYTAKTMSPNPIVSVTSNGFRSNKSGTYYSTLVTLKLKSKDHGSNISYKVNVSGGSNSNIVLYNENGIKDANILNNNFSVSSTGNDDIVFKFYIKAIGATKGELFNVKVTGNSSTKYSYVNIWKPVGSNDKILTGKQGLVTTTEKEYKHEIYKNFKFYIPEPNKYKFTAVKVNEDGDELKNATLKLYVATVNSESECKSFAFNDSHFACDVKNGTSSCSKSFEKAETQYKKFCYKITEFVTPDGYLTGNLPAGYIDFDTVDNNDEKFQFEYENNSYDVSESIFNGEYETFTGGVCKTGNVYKIGIDKDHCVAELPSQDSEQPVQDENPSQPTDICSGDNNGGCIVGDYVSDAICLEKVGNEYKKADDITYDNTKKVSPCDVNFYKVILKDGNHIVIDFPNKMDTVNISKQDISGNEVSGAHLKICSKDSYSKQKLDCVASTTLAGESMEWDSEGYIKSWSGVRQGDYYLIETIAPDGYLKTSTAIEFSVDKNGKVGTTDKSNYDDKTDSIVIKNKLNEVTISKQDIDDKKELPGAKLYICEAEKQDNGTYKMMVDDSNNCVPVILADGSVAEWKSEKEPHKIHGLRPGSYYLVEDKAPFGYLDAEAIVFTMNEDGTISDENGKSVKDNKIVMYDSENPGTGTFIIIIVATIMVIAGGVAFYFIKKRNNK